MGKQSAWLIFLEFLTVAEACHREGRLFDEPEHYYPLIFRPSKRLHLRNILFLDEQISHIAQQYHDNRMAWKTWLAWIEEHAKLPPPRDFSYLRDRFSSFHDFAKLVELLRSAMVESESNKRWSSQFVFPFGPYGIYEDLDYKNWGRQYVYFGRTGELLYLMLCRSTQRVALTSHFTHMFETPNKWNTLLQRLQPSDNDEESQSENRGSKTSSYLPYMQHPTFDHLSEDWLAIVQLSLPGFDAFPHVRTLGAFHMLLYQLTIATQWCGQEFPVLVCEVVAPKKTLVRELSITSYQANNQLPSDAIQQLIDKIEQSDDWQTALAQPGAFAHCREILRNRVWWPMKDTDYEGSTDPNHLLKEFRSKALRRHRQHVSEVHHTYGRDIGLISRRATNAYRYAPTDGLLKTLILANVNRRMELSTFLDHLYRRYGLSFGEHEAEDSQQGHFDKKAFAKNGQRLEQRLGSLGLLRRLSDGCAYVENPYARRLP